MKMPMQEARTNASVAMLKAMCLRGAGFSPSNALNARKSSVAPTPAIARPMIRTTTIAVPKSGSTT